MSDNPYVKEQMQSIRNCMEDIKNSNPRYNNLKLIRKTGKECDLPLLDQVEFCPHCGKMICPEIITKLFNCNYCHHCGGRVEY